MQKRRLGCLVLAVLHFSESGMVRAAWVQCRAFPHELQPEPISRACRVIPLQICGVSAPKKRTAEAVNAGGTAEGMPFVPIDGMMGFIFL